MKFSYSLIKRLLPRVPPKKKLVEALNLRSFEAEDAGGDTIEVALPANRYSDAASHIGVAREAGAIFRLPFATPVKAIVNLPAGKGFVTVDVREPKRCARQAARYFEIPRLKASPGWMKKALVSCGIRPLNAVVDITNYVAIETGEPLHAFDADTLAGRGAKPIIVRSARRGEKVKTLEGKEYALDSGMLVLADTEKALDIAGIKGGARTGISGKTKRIILVASNFDPVGIYRTSRALGLVTDASVRFSHGVSPALVDWGMDRGTELLLRAGAKLRDSADTYPKPVRDEVIGFDLMRFSSLIGAPTSEAEAKRVFRALGFSIERKTGKGGASFLVRVPPWRTDIERSEDLIEEVSRLKGYERLKAMPPLVSISPASEEDTIVLKERARELLSNLRLDEIYTHSFVPEPEGGAVALENPISREFTHLRPDLETGLRGALRANSRFFKEVRVFEIGKVFTGKRAGGVKEELRLGIALAEKERSPILELKGICDAFFKGMGFTDLRIVEVGGALRVEDGHEVLGTLKAFKFEKGWQAAVGELSLEKALTLAQGEREFRPLPKYPAVVRDISLLLGGEARIGRVLETISLSSPKLIEDVDLVDEYADEKLGGRQSLTFRIVFQADDRTLTDAEVAREMDKIVRAVKRAFRAEVR